MKGWNGSGWVSLGGTMAGNTMFLVSSQIYSAFAFIGTPSGVVSVAEGQAIPGKFRLEQNYPNPFNPSTIIHYDLPQRSIVRLSVFNTLGQEVAVLISGEESAGYHEVRFDAVGLPSGMYFYRLQAGDYVQSRKLLLLK